MSAKVFISCGQYSDEEVATAKSLKKWFAKQGYDPYVAKEAQSLDDVNKAIVGELENADYYLLVDFRREKIGTNQCNEDEYRGSLFTNQELALAHYMQFDNAILLQQQGVSSSIMKCNTWGSRKVPANLSIYGKTI